MLSRVLIDRPPFATPQILERAPWDPRAQWPCRWLLPPAEWATPLVLAYRLVLDLAAPLRCRIHVSADERYELWLDGERAGCGPERCDVHMWAYESFDLELPAGRHVLMARVWALGGLAPWAQCRLTPGFICACDSAAIPVLGSGTAPWRVRRIAGYTFAPLAAGNGGGAVETVDAAAAHWDPLDAGDSAEWVEALPGDPGNNGDHVMLKRRHLLVPAVLPAQVEAPLPGLHAAAADTAAGGTPWRQGGELAAWNALLTAGTPLTVPPRSRCRALIDLGTYACGRPELTASGGGSVSLAISEALLHPGATGEVKVHRDLIDGGRIAPGADRVLPGGDTTTWRPLWWRAGRWLEVVVESGDQALVLHRLGFTTTGYPFTASGGGRDLDPATAAIHAACVRTWRACAHETYMDCPHWEQLMYVGDTRVQALLTYALSDDDRLPRRALALFDSGRAVGRGLLPDAYPCGSGKLIPPFALWWIGMLHDHAWWRGGPSSLSHLPGARSVVDHFLARLGDDGLWISSEHWNYLDWCPGWTHGTPTGGEAGGRNAAFNWQLVHALGQLADLEELAGEPELAARARRHRDRLADAIRRVFWDAAAGCFADEPGHRGRSEHAQVLALLSGVLTPSEHASVARALVEDPALVRTSCYFSHYLFEAYRAIGRNDLLLCRLADWQVCIDLGLLTTPEGFGQTRSDCHAWAAHPLFHHLASLLGVRPGAPGFASVRIAPCPGPLPRISGDVAHPLGTISATVERVGDGIRASVTLPPGLSGELVWAGRSRALQPGAQTIEL
jgi:alpha-L-rhamnosidase